MGRYETDPEYRKAVDEQLTGGPSQKSLAYRKKMNEQPKASTEELIKKVQKEFSEDKITTRQRPSALDTAVNNINKYSKIYDEQIVAQYSPTTNLFTNKDRTIGFQKHEHADLWNKTVAAKPSEKPASKPAAEKPFYKKGEAKIIIDELKRQKRKTNPLLKPSNKELKIDHSPIPTLADVAKEDPHLKILEEKFKKIMKQRDYEKTRGIANLFGVKTDDV